MQILQCHAGDEQRLLDLLDVFAEAFEEPDTYARRRPDRAYLARLLASPAFIAVVAEVEGRVIGGLTAYDIPKPEQDRHELFIYDLAVQEAFRRRGIATALIHAMRKIAREREAYAVIIQSEQADLPSTAVYRQFADPLPALHFEINP